MSESDLATLLNPREVLAYLNDLGIRNVNGEMLKEFMCDLKRLIRYDLRNKTEHLDNQIDNQTDIKGPERLHSCSTFSSRSKCVNTKEPGSRKPLSNICDNRSLSCRSRDSCKKLTEINLTRKAKSAETKSSCQSKGSKPPCRNSNLIRVAVPEKIKKSDPVSLYHYYNSLWEKYKSNRPGENSWSDLRWSVREKMLGGTQTKPHKVMVQTADVLAKRREAWID